jgi:hypothetical protein
MRTKFLPVGTQFELNGHTYEVVEQHEKLDLCLGCDFFIGHMLRGSPQLTPMCIKHFRKDQKSVVFKKIK